MSNTDTSRAAFEAWHSDRAARILAEAKELAARWIAEGGPNSPATSRMTLLRAIGGADETGWVAWQASRKQALTELVAHFDAKLSGYEVFGPQIADEIQEHLK